LVDQDWKVAIRLHPFGVARANDRLARWPHYQRFAQRTRWPHFTIGTDLKPRMRHHRAFLGETFDVLRFLREITQWNKEWEVGIAVPGRANHGVELPLHVFPNTEPPGAHHHATANVGRFCQLGRANDLL